MAPVSRTRRRTVGSATAILALAALSGCAGESVSGSNQPGVPKPPPVSTDAPNPAAQTSIGTSSADDLAAALDANDVDDSERWAEIVSNGRPYPPGDPGRLKLRQVLTRFQADPDTTTKITAALVP
ncbi:hypothetical protein [Pseudonocardia sp. KRD291]|uniref:hypothetical protein n=1 Tax=Pseudonocardia sp. KRD291 TaxID=2792007 RepID=UPI001C4A51E2|nr:hypothetical protein [Pseudonocardia sp. KRD291]MBW0102889.1 hypothetical protein [Pseudonocardia sp. KRD291]